MLEGFNQEVSTFASDVDRAFWITTGISTAMFICILGVMLYFIWRYHHSRVKPNEIQNIKNHLTLEIAWTVIPSILLFIIFFYGYSAFREIRTMPQDTFNIDVLGKRWSWTFTYPNGKRTAELYVPEGKNIRLNLHAPLNDVIHSFYVPAFRIKEDVVPGRENRIWFRSTRPGRYDIQCAEYCGTRHSYMLSKVEVMKQKAFDRWYASDTPTPHAKGMSKEEEGEMLYKTLGCVSCHSIDASTILGPSFKGIYGSRVKVLREGQLIELVVDDAYIRDSIRTPEKDVVVNFEKGIMPNLSEHIDEKQMDAIIAFIKAQGGNKSIPGSSSTDTDKKHRDQKMATDSNLTQETPSGATLFNTQGCIGCHSLDGSPRAGPSLKGVYQRQQEVITEGKRHTITADEAYLYDSIQKPNADIVKGFTPGIMPAFGEMLSEEEVKALVNYLKTI